MDGYVDVDQFPPRLAPYRKGLARPGARGVVHRDTFAETRRELFAHLTQHLDGEGVDVDTVLGVPIVVVYFRVYSII